MGSWEWDLGAGEMTWSAELYRIFGVSPQNFTPSFDEVLMLIHPEDREKVRWHAMALLGEGRPHAVECRVDGGTDARVLDAQGYVELDEQEAPLKLRGTVRDITERKRVERELRSAHHQLARRTRELERSNVELEQFAYDASHDLSEPLRIMARVGERLARDYGGKLDEEARAMVASLVDGAERTQMLIADLLEYSRVSREPPVRSWVDSAEILAATLDLLEESIGEKEAHVQVGSLPKVRAHPCHLAQLFRNLISNALKYSGEQPLSVRVNARREDAAWCFSVHDNGIGIDPCQADRVFEAFRRLHPPDVYAGTGMGLSICKRIVERHGGRIWVEPANGGGSVFYFTLPDSGECQGT